MIFIVPILGFTEGTHRRSGTENLHRDILRPFAAPTVQVLPPQRWNLDPEDLAAYLRRNDADTLILVAYSWGGGFAAPRLIRAADHLGIRIPLVLLCDPVYRPLWLPAWMGPNPLAVRAMIPGSAKIRIPAGPLHVHSVRQTISRPAGHDLLADSPLTTIHDPIVLPYSHTRIDEAQEWRALVYDQIHAHLARR